VHRNDKLSVLKRAALSAALIAAFAGAPLAANAAGMGKITVLSALGQPLRAELDVTATREELASLVARVAPVEAFRQANLEYAGVLSGIKFTLDKRPDGRPYFRVHTDRAVNDPFIDVLVELGWSSGRLVREYAFLLDPPELKNDAASAGLVTPPVAAQTVQPSPAAPSEAVPPALSPQAAAPAVEQAAPAPKKKAAAPVAEKKPKVASEPVPATEDSVKDNAAATRKVKPGDTLSKIATENAIDGVNLDQMLVALFNGNRDAFIAGNLNRLRAGKILSIPDAATAGAVSTSEARKIVVAQSADFNAYRNRLAAAAEQAPAVEQTQQSSSGKIAPKVEEKTPEATGKDKLQVSRSEADAKAGKGKLSEEDTIARDKALKEANSRIGDLEKNLGDLKQLAEMKSQAAGHATAPASNSSTTPPVAPANAAPAGTAAAAKGIAIEGAPAVSGTAATSDVPAVSAVAVAPAADGMPQPKPDKKPIVAPPAFSQPSFIDDNPLLVYGGGAAVVALLGFLGFRSWKRKRDADISENVTISDLSASSIFGSAISESVDTSVPSQTDFGHSTLDAVDTGKTGVDPIQEAEVYMAYGRDSQAEEILRDALRKDPDNLAVYLKLLEIYAGRKSVSQFNEVATDLHDRSAGDSPEWTKAVELGRSLDPSNPLYGAAVVEVEHGSLSTMLVDDPMVSTTILPPQSSQELESSASQEIEEVSGPLDFDLDLGAPEQAADKEVTSGSASDLDFDLDLDLGNDEGKIAAASDSALDVNLDAPSTEEGHTIDFNILAPAADASSAGGNAADEHGLDFDLGDSLRDVPSASAPALDLSSISLDLDKPADLAHGAGDSSEVATKLELAQAYEEMGDQEGARELLQEVLAEGSPAQQEAARSKLAQLK
jgi:pilus assembly protein FimV